MYLRRPYHNIGQILKYKCSRNKNLNNIKIKTQDVESYFKAYVTRMHCFFFANNPVL